MYANLITRKINRKIKQLCFKLKSLTNLGDIIFFATIIAIIVITLVHEFKIIENLKAAMLL
jgi:hypothetical protein